MSQTATQSVVDLLLASGVSTREEATELAQNMNGGSWTAQVLDSGKVDEQRFLSVIGNFFRVPVTSLDPKTIDRIAPNDNKEVQALITPTEKAIAGDYVTTIRASARGESASSTFRVTVTTSTMWGIAGVGIIGVALLVMVGAVARFGRR